MFRKLIRRGRRVALLAIGSAIVYYNFNIDWTNQNSVDHKKKIPLYTMEEVGKHNTPSNAWIVVNGKIYNITDLLKWHPGGSGILLEYVGGDATHQFNSINHSLMAKAKQMNLLVGEVRDYDKFLQEERLKEEKHKNELNKTHNRKHVVIVGNGICGVAAAYFLSLAGLYDITVVDKSHLVGGTALASSAILFLGGNIEKDIEGNDKNEKKKPNLSNWSGHWQYDIMKQFQEEGENIEFVEKGTLGVIQTQEQLEYLQKQLSPTGRMYGTQELLSKEKTLELEPSLSHSIYGSTLCKKGATFDPFLVCNAFAKRAQRNGVVFHYGMNVVNIERSSNENQEKKFILQGSNGFEIKADMLLLCSGWKVKDHANMLGHIVPVRGVHGQMFATRNDNVRLNHNIFSWEGPHYWGTHPALGHQDTLEATIPYTNRFTRHLYGLQISNGTLKFGGDRITGDLEGKVVGNGIRATAEHVAEVIPQLKNCEIWGWWSGTMPFVKDQTPLIGELEKGLWVLTGAPFTKGAAYAKLLAEFILGDDSHKEFKPVVNAMRFESKKN